MRAAVAVALEHYQYPARDRHHPLPIRGWLSIPIVHVWVVPLLQAAPCRQGVGHSPGERAARPGCAPPYHYSTVQRQAPE